MKLSKNSGFEAQLKGFYVAVDTVDIIYTGLLSNLLIYLDI